MRRWQYKFVQQKVLVGLGGSDSGESPGRDEYLNRFGRDGWELVSVTLQSYRRESDPTALQGYALYSYFFKREEP